METFAANYSTDRVRKATLQGRDYLVAPVSLIVPGVLNGSRGPLYYPVDEVAKDPTIWNGVPIVVYHPQIEGQHVSARDPDILANQGIGQVLRAKFNGKKLVGEGWFEIEATKRVDNRIYQALMEGKPIELSTGLFTENEEATGVFNGRPYTHIARNYKADHLAVFADMVGACSLRDGCGVLINAATPQETPSWVQRIQANHQPTDNVWSAAARAAAAKARRRGKGNKGFSKTKKNKGSKVKMSAEDKAHSKKRLKVLKGSAGKDGKVSIKGKRVTPEQANRHLDRLRAAKKSNSKPTQTKSKPAKKTVKAALSKVRSKNSDAAARKKAGPKGTKIPKKPAVEKPQKKSEAKVSKTKSKQARKGQGTGKFTKEQRAGMELAKKFNKQGVDSYTRGHSRKGDTESIGTKLKRSAKQSAGNLVQKALKKIKSGATALKKKIKKKLTGNEQVENTWTPQARAAAAAARKRGKKPPSHKVKTAALIKRGKNFTQDVTSPLKDRQSVKVHAPGSSIHGAIGLVHPGKGGGNVIRIRAKTQFGKTDVDVLRHQLRTRKLTGNGWNPPVDVEPQVVNVFSDEAREAARIAREQKKKRAAGRIQRLRQQRIAERKAKPRSELSKKGDAIRKKQAAEKGMTLEERKSRAAEANKRTLERYGRRPMATNSVWSKIVVNSQGQTMKLKPEAKTRIINDLIANTGVGVVGPWVESDRVALVELPDEKLKHMDNVRKETAAKVTANKVVPVSTGAPQNGETKDVEVTIDGKVYALNSATGAYEPKKVVTGNCGGHSAQQTTNDKPMTEEEWMKRAPARVRAAVGNAMRLEDEEKERLISHIVSNVSDEEARKKMAEKYMTKSLDELQEMYDLVPQKAVTGNTEVPRPRYFGPGANPVTPPKPVFNAQDMIPEQEIDWNEVSESHNRQRQTA